MIAVDTNVLIYADMASGTDARHELALALLEKLSLINCCIPLQVLGEFLNVSQRKQLLSPAKAIMRVNSYAALFTTPVTLLADLVDAGRLSTDHRLQYFDAVIVTVARRAGATMLLSEDMQDGLSIDGLTIVNPFVAANEALLADWFGSGV